MHPSRASGWMWHPSPTHNPMVKQNKQTTSSCQASSLDWSNHFSEHLEHGLMSCRLCFGVCAPHPTVQPDSLHSSSYTAQRQSFPLTSSSMHLVALCIPRRKSSKLEKMAVISEKKHACWLCLGRKYTCRTCTTTTARRSAPLLFARVTWCSAESSSRRADTSCPLLGKVLSSSVEH